MRALFFSCCFLFLFGLSAQGEVHFERPFHVAGEVAWFSAYPAGEVLPARVRVSVHKPSGELLDYFFLTEDDGAYRGYYRWPFTTETGYYRLHLSALTADERVVSLGTARHRVFADKRVDGSGPAAPFFAANKGSDLQLSVADGKVTVEGLKGEPFSISAVQRGVVPAGRTTVPLTDAQPAPAYTDTLFYRAKLTAADGTPLATNLLPVVDPRTLRFGFTKAAADGTFNYYAAPFEGEKTVYVRDVDDRDVKPVLEVPTLPAITESPRITDDVAAYIDLARRRRKIYQLFATVETELNVSPAPEERRALDPSRSFRVQDYKKFPDMFNFFKEVAGELRVRQKKDNYTARLYNAPTQRYFTGSPLYLIDGRPTRDDNFVLTLDPGNIDLLAFYYGDRKLRRTFPALGSQGVVQIETVRGIQNFPAADSDDGITIRGLQPQASLTARDAATSEVPAISPVLLWETGSGSESVSIDVPASDDGGECVVTVVVRDGRGGIRSATATFSQPVKK